MKLLKNKLEILKKENEELKISLYNAEITKYKIQRRGSSFRNQNEIKFFEKLPTKNQSIICDAYSPKMIDNAKIQRGTTTTQISSPAHLLNHINFTETVEKEESNNQQSPNIDDMITKVLNLQIENTELCKENKEYKIYIDVYKDFTQKHTNENLILKGLNEQLKSDLESLKLKAKEKEREVKNVELIKITHSKELEKASDKIKKLIEKKENILKENHLLQKSCSEYHIQLEKITTENGMLQKLKIELEINNKYLNSKVDLLGKDNSEYSKEIKLQKSSISQLILEKQNLEKVISNIKDKLDLCEEKLNQFNKIGGEVLKIISENSGLFKGVYGIGVYNGLQDIPQLLNKIILSTSGNKSPLRNAKFPPTPNSGRYTPRKDLFSSSPSKFPNFNNPKKCPICQSNQDYESIKHCITNSDKFRKQIVKEIASDKYWTLSTNVIVLEKSEIQLIISMIFSSSKIQGIDFGCNLNFDETLGKYYLEAINRNESLEGIILFKNNLTIDFKKTALKTFISKKKMKFFVIDKSDLPKENVDELAKINNLEIVEVWPHPTLPTSDFPQFWNQHNLLNVWFFCKKSDSSNDNENLAFHY